MEVKIKLIDDTLPLPIYQTSGSVGFDIYTRITAEIPPHSFLLLPTNLIIATPPDLMLMIAIRSSSAKNKGINMRNSIGVIDQDYKGDDDEIQILVQNLTDKVVSVERGERLAQGIFVRIERAVWQVVGQMNKTNRGGFGSTN